ncbi:Fungal specific transcription factor domain-containing protein [Cladophialophora immunda]|nr:Fungal specific transcription factor domain-containing protein [Cladophialophora immunda]
MECYSSSINTWSKDPKPSVGQIGEFAEIRLMPATFPGTRRESHARQLGWIEKSHLNNRGPTYDSSGQPKPCSGKPGSNQGYFPTYQNLEKEDETNENEKKPLLQPATEWLRQSGADLELAMQIPAGEAKLLGPNIFRLFFQCYLENFIPVTFPAYTHGEEHTCWIIQTARANQMVFFAIVAAGASICARLPETVDSRCAISGTSNIPTGQIFTIKMAALKHIRHTFTHYQARDLITILYSVTCLAIAAIMDGDTPSLKIHSTGLRYLVSSINSSDIPRHVLEVVLS